MITFIASTILLLVSALIANATAKFRYSKTYTESLTKNKAVGLIANVISVCVFAVSSMFSLVSLLLVVSFGYFTAENAVISLISNAPVLWVYVAIALIFVLIAVMVVTFFINKKFLTAEKQILNVTIKQMIYLGIELGSALLIIKILLLFIADL